MARTAAQIAASRRNLEKARAVRAAAATGRKAGSIPKPSAPKGTTSRKTRGVGTKGLRSNFVPYARANKRSQTVGYNAGTIIPGTHRRIVTGAYVRVESTRNKTAADRFVAKHAKRVFPEGTRRATLAGKAKRGISLNKPSIRGSINNAEVRLGTSRGAGPTVIVRRGKHKTSVGKSTAGINTYDKQMRRIQNSRTAKKVAGKKARPQRRRAARKKS